MRGNNSGNRNGGKREQLWSPMFVLLILFTLCSFVVGQGLNSGTSVYLARYGGAATYTGMLAMVFSVSAGVVRLLSGPIIDTRGRRIVMLVGSVVMLIGTFMPTMGHQPALLVAARLLQGVGLSATTTAAATAAADTLPQQRMGEGIGFYGLGQAIAMSIGPALALFLVNTDPAQNLFYGLSLSALLALLLALACIYEKRPQLLPEHAVYRQRAEAGELDKTSAEDEGADAGKADDRAQDGADTDANTNADPAANGKGRAIIEHFFEKRALSGAIPQLALCPAFAFGIFFMGLYGSTMGVANAGLFYTVSAAAMIAVRIKAAALMDRTPPIKLIAAATAAGLLAYAMLLYCNVVLQGTALLDVVFYLAGVPYGFCLGISMPLNQSIAVKNTPPERWGVANALFQLSIDCGMGFACLVWGVLNDALGFSVTICCIMVVIVLSLLVAKTCYPKG